MDSSASTGAGTPVAETENAVATPVVAESGPGFAPNSGAAAASTATSTACVATPSSLLAVKTKVWVAPPSAAGGR